MNEKISEVIYDYSEYESDVERYLSEIDSSRREGLVKLATDPNIPLGVRALSINKLEDLYETKEEEIKATKGSETHQ